MEALARTLIVLGIALVVVGGLLLLGARLPFPFLGRLPGDITIDRPGFTLYIPLATSVILSLLLSIGLTLFFKFGGK